MSRGFTLEGLTVSYFLRNTQMYDTLLQMGRWFGYRDGFGDLCRLFIKPEAHDWYGYIAQATEELRDKIRQMEAAGLTPEDFGLAVRSHPGTLLVTARNKMRTAEQIVREVGLADSLVESAVVHASEDTRKFNVERMSALLGELVAAGPPAEAIGTRGATPAQLFREVRVDQVLDFISAFAIHPGNIEMQPEPLMEYIRQRGFPQGDVVVASSSTAGQDTLDIHGMTIGLQRRNVVPDKNFLKVSGNARRVASRGLEKSGLLPEEIRAAEARHQALDDESGRKTTIADHFYRHERTRPLLMLHFIRSTSKATSSANQIHAAYGISFPKLREGEKEKRVAYTANLIAYRQLFSQIEPEGDEEDEIEPV